MSEGWGVKQLSEICEIRPAKRQSKETLSDADDVSFVPMEDLPIGGKYLSASQIKPLGKVYSGYTYFSDGDVLLAKITPCFQNGKLAIARDLKNGVGFGSSEFFVFRPSEMVNAEFLFYFLSRKNFREDGVAKMSGAVGHQRVPKEFIEDLPVPLPPLSEQKRIVAILDEAFGAIARAKENAARNLANARELFDSWLMKLESVRGQQWTYKDLIEVCSLFVDSPHRTPKYQEQGFSALRPRDVVSGKLDLNNARRVSETEYLTQCKRHVPQGGDIVYSRELSFGWAAMLPPSSKVCLSQGMCLFHPSDVMDGEFLVTMLNGPAGRLQATKAAVGTAHPHINLGSIKGYEIPVPSKDEQKKINSICRKYRDGTDRLEYLYQQKLTALDELKQSLLQKAFTGQLTSQSKELELVP